MDIYEANRKAWNSEMEKRNFWTIAVSEDRIRDAKQGRPEVWVTPFQSIPQDWLADLKGKKVLVACGGGGQQTPILSAFGCEVTSLDISERQIEQDRATLDNFGLKAETICANVLDMPFPDAHFNAVIMPQALNFIDDIERLYSEVHRVLKNDGVFIFGTANPILYMFDEKLQEHRLKVKYTIPFSHTRSFSQRNLLSRLSKNDTLEFSHTLDTIMGNLINKGFAIDGFYTDLSGSEVTDSFVNDCHLAIKATKTNHGN